MRGLPKRAVVAAENLAIALLKDAIKQHGKRIPVNNPDYAEAFGVLRGVLAYGGNATTFQPIRTTPGSGQEDYDSVSKWIHTLIDRAMVEAGLDNGEIQNI